MSTRTLAFDKKRNAIYPYIVNNSAYNQLLLNLFFFSDFDIISTIYNLYYNTIITIYIILLLYKFILDQITKFFLYNQYRFYN